MRRDRERIEIGLYAVKSVKNVCSKHLSQLSELLKEIKPKLNNYNFSNGVQVPVLGQNRLAIIKLISRLINLNDEFINQELIRSKILNSILDMMFVYKWNNFLHFQLKDILLNCFTYDFKQIPQFHQMLHQDVEMKPEGEEAKPDVPKKNLQEIRVEDLETQEKKSFTHHVSSFFFFSFKISTLFKFVIVFQDFKRLWFNFKIGSFLG